uniref:Uncharacterized protein n=1 Tax=Anopheles maculatus TaxID=74869 RepID=A0A182S9Q9_9DIPT
MCVDTLVDALQDFMGGNGEVVHGSDMMLGCTSGAFTGFEPSLLLTMEGNSSLLSDTRMVVLAVMSAERTRSPPASCDITTTDSKRPGSAAGTGVTVDTLARLLWFVSVDDVAAAAPSMPPTGSNDSVVISGQDFAVAISNEPPPLATSTGSTGLWQIIGFIIELAIASENAALYSVGELSSTKANICVSTTTK